MKWMLTCKETSVLASRAMDQRLPFGDRVALQVHLAICENCARFARQLHEMRRLFRAETGVEDEAAGLSDEARQRIAAGLQDRLDS